MFKKKLLGIYCDRDALHYVSMTNGIFGGCSLKSPASGIPAFDRRKGNGYAHLKEFLKEIPEDSSRVIYLAIPRSRVFTREISLPAMPVEDALLSVQNSLAIYSHLSPDAIYYDLIVTEEDTDTLNILLFYASKDEMDRYAEIFSETGHDSSLKAIFPLSYGVSLVLGAGVPGAESGGMLFSLDQESIFELVVLKDAKMRFSMSLSGDSEEEKQIVISTLQQRFPFLSKDGKVSPVLSKDSSSSPVLSKGSSFPTLSQDSSSSPVLLKDASSPSVLSKDSNSSPETVTIIKPVDASDAFRASAENHRKFKKFPPFELNRASAALAHHFLGVQQISLDDQPVKIRVFNPIYYILPIICIIAVSLYFVSVKMDTKLEVARANLAETREQVTRLEGELAPLQEQIDTLKKASKFKTDVEQFMQSRPALYTAINEIAELVPEGTWFSNLTFNGNSLILRGRGEDALKIVELLRSSDIFSDVMLKGSVNRRNTGDEHFTVSLELKQNLLREQGDTL
ncbi:PilN domain-containing protein [Desulfamplus magnetovallimortis]|uniref:PilN domain-containing protein n=1 Tax=Desulfamplus magnetovallimortis TaxID=1246637 RepID=UPI0009BB769F|nr:PilN domain-containing protein [Desulfamplus magnetovallimortis]